MFHPYQFLHLASNILVAASGSQLDTFKMEDGSFLSSWQSSALLSRTTQSETQDVVSDTISPNNEWAMEPPAKRIKMLNDSEGHQNTPETTKPSKNGHKNQKNKLSDYPCLPAEITSIIGTKDGKHVIIVVGEDKSIRVLNHDGNGSLIQVSRRCMPKRPSAITLTIDDSTIICADKFGDVYSLPLLYENSTAESVPAKDEYAIKSSNPEVPKPFISAATNLTVHSARNLRALQNQKKQTKQPSSDKRDPSFQHDLLLGHVSMLTSIAAIEQDDRNYIVTADRDEHIRVSRGIPQAHIIERFCLGHSQFVSCLCFPKTLPGILISGGGDDELFVWDWREGRLLGKVDLRKPITELLSTIKSAETLESTTREPSKIAVSKICDVGIGKEVSDGSIVVSCEGLPALFFFSLSISGSAKHFQSVVLDGNPLDMIVTQAGSVIVSVDTVHEAGSTSKIRKKLSNMRSGMLKIFQSHQWLWAEEELFGLVDQTHNFPKGTVIVDGTKGLSNLLYNKESFRKRGEEN